jgi:hypothetical protein
VRQLAYEVGVELPVTLLVMPRMHGTPAEALLKLPASTTRMKSWMPAILPVVPMQSRHDLAWMLAGAGLS